MLKMFHVEQFRKARLHRWLALKSHAVYLIYGLLSPKEKKIITPGNGHEEIFLALDGKIKVMDNKNKAFIAKEGEAFHLLEDLGARPKVTYLREGP